MAVRIADTLKQQNNLTTFPVAYGEDIWLDKNKGSGTKNYSNLQEMFNNDELGGNNLLVTIMPTASETYLDTVLLYIGETGTYKYGTYYKCISDGETPPTYSWVDAEIGGGTKIFYGTMDEWDALTTDEKKKYNYMADDNAGGSYIDTYSTSEVKTNKVWIDGRKIYRKVFTGLSYGSSYQTWETTGITISDVAQITNFVGVRAPSQGLVYPMSIRMSGTSVDVYFNNGLTPRATGAIVEYTKTTD